jgi:hypothetical protein
VLVTGTHAVMPPGSKWARRTRGRLPIAVHIGPPIHPRDGEHRTETMERVRLFFEESGAATTRDRRVEARRTA